MSARDRNFWIELSVLVFLLAAGVTAFVVSAMSPLNKDDLKIQAGDLRTFASVGRQLAAQYASGRLTETFYRGQAGLLSDKVESARKTIEGSRSETAVAADHSEISRLSDDLFLTISDLESTSNPASFIDRLSSLENAARSMEDKLK